MRSSSIFVVALAVLFAVAPFARSDDKKKPDRKADEKKPDEKKDEVYLDGVEKIEVKDLGLRVQRPSRDWTFLNLELLAKQELAKNPGAKEGLERLKARLWYGGASASFYVYSWVDERDDLAIETLGKEQVEQTRGFLKDSGKVVGSGPSRLGKNPAWAFEVEGSLLTGGDELTVAKQVVYRAADKRVFLLALEHPKKNAELVKKDKAKLFAHVKL